METRREQDANSGMRPGRAFTASLLIWVIRAACDWNRDITRDGDVEFLGVDDGLTLSMEFRSDLGTKTIVVLDYVTGCFRMWIDGRELGNAEWN